VTGASEHRLKVQQLADKLGGLQDLSTEEKEILFGVFIIAGNALASETGGNQEEKTDEDQEPGDPPSPSEGFTCVFIPGPAGQFPVEPENPESEESISRKIDRLKSVGRKSVSR
jgi:hypothetical protein